MGIYSVSRMVDDSILSSGAEGCGERYGRGDPGWHSGVTLPCYREPRKTSSFRRKPVVLFNRAMSGYPATSSH